MTAIAAGIRALFGAVSAAARLPEGWNETVDWNTLEEGIVKARNENKIMLAVVQADGSPACKHLQFAFNSSRELQDLSKQFVMILVPSNEVAQVSKFAPDGNYLPRILFFNQDFQLIPLVKRSPKVKRLRYMYMSDKPLVATMKRLLDNPEKYRKTYDHTNS